MRQPHPPPRMTVAAEMTFGTARALHTSLWMDDLATFEFVWLRTHTEVALLRKRRVSGGHVRVHTTIPQRCGAAQFAFAQHTYRRAYIINVY